MKSLNNTFNSKGSHSPYREGEMTETVSKLLFINKELGKTNVKLTEMNRELIRRLSNITRPVFTVRIYK